MALLTCFHFAQRLPSEYKKDCGCQSGVTSRQVVY